MSKKKSKGFDAVKQFGGGGERNFIPGWIGGITSPRNQRIAQERLKKQMREGVSIFAEARAERLKEQAAARQVDEVEDREEAFSL